MGLNTEIPTTINVMTYNCFGLKYIAPYRKERLTEIGHRISCVHPAPDIIGLQECWTQEDYSSIVEQIKHILPFSKFYFSGIFGAGLVILSKWPIEESSMFRYSLNGRPTAFFRGDWFVGKGVACARIRLGPNPKHIVDVFCTHLHAPYESEPHDSYICHRTAQAWEIAKLMRSAAEKGHLVLGLGDFNMLPLSLAHQLITGYAPVQDAWRILHPDSSIGPASSKAEKGRNRPVPNASYNITENGAASDGVLNTWRWPKAQQKRLFKGEKINVDNQTPDPNAKRLDYIFVSTKAASDSLGWRTSNVKVGMTEPHPTIGCSLSDHFSVEATLTFSETSNTNLESLGNGVNFVSESAYESILSMISAYNIREIRQRRYRLTHFGASVLLFIVCSVGIWWTSSKAVAFVLLLLSTLGLGAGVIDGLIGGLFVSSELRALKEFEWEIRNAKGIVNEANGNTLETKS